MGNPVAGLLGNVSAPQSTPSFIVGYKFSVTTVAPAAMLAR